MAGIFGGGSSTKPTYNSLQVQTSSLNLPIPLVWGAQRVSPNLIWFGDFKTHKKSSGGKGGGGKGATTYTYSAAVAMALCEGPIVGIGKVWADKQKTTLSKLKLTLFLGTSTQSPWSYLTTKHPSQALSYADTAYVASSSYNLGSSASLPQHHFEVRGKFYNTYGAYGYPDANPADIIEDYLTNPKYGLGFPADQLGDLTLYRNYCPAQGILLSPLLTNSEQANMTLDRWAQLTNTWIFWNGSQMKYVPLGDTPLTGMGKTYNPPLLPVYNIGMDDYVSDGGDPVSVSRMDPADVHNQIRLDTRDRVNKEYQSNPVEYKDSASIDQYGTISAPVSSGSDVCDTRIALIIVTLLGQRSVYIRNTYKFTLSYQYMLLEVGDIITLTEPNIGLHLFPVRISSIEEDDRGNISFEAEEYPALIGSIVEGVTQEASGGSVNYAIDPGDVNPPLIMEPSPQLTAAAQPQVWVGLSGGENWGGATVWISINGSDYTNIGIVEEKMRQGVLTASLPLHVDPDTVNTLSVDSSNSDAEFNPAVHADAIAVPPRTLSVVDTEIIAYGSAVLTGTSTYDFTDLRRGLYGTTPALHNIGSNFWRLDPALMFIYDLPPSYVGQTLYFKFTSFNIFNDAEQDLADVAVYTYVPTGVAFEVAPPGSMTLVQTSTIQADGSVLMAIEASWGASPDPLVGSYEVGYTIDGGSTWSSQTVSAPGTMTRIAPVLASTLYGFRVRAISQNGVAQSSYVTGSITTTAVYTAAPPAPTGFSATAVVPGVASVWTYSADPSVQNYKLYRGTGASVPFGSCAVVSRPARGTTTYLDSSVAASTTYTYYLVASNAFGDSAPTAGVNVTTMAAAAGVETYRWVDESGNIVVDEEQNAVHGDTVVNRV